MATFEVQVEGLTGLTIDGSSAPTTTELAQFLKDGVIDVTNRCIQLKPENKEDFIRGSSTQSSNGFATNGADIISVIREAGADGDTDGSTAWRNCRKVSAHLRSRVVDTESLHFASKYNPVYIINNNSAVNVYPVPDGTDDGYRVYYINNEPKGDGLVDELAAGHTTIGYFPKDKVYLVVMYAAIKSLQNALSAVNISTFSLSASAPATVPSAPNITGGSVSPITIDALPSAPNYTQPTVSGATEEITATMDADSAGYGTDADFLNFSKWFSVAGDFIEDEEDIELAQAQIQKISTYLNAYSQAMQNQLNIFNEGNAVYQAAIQRNLQQAQINMQDAQKEADLTLQASIQDYTLELQRVSTDASKYQALVSAEVQAYQQEIAEKSAEYQWQLGRLQELKQEYNQAFAMMAPPQPQQAGGR
jgi:hypothetical protein